MFEFIRSQSERYRVTKLCGALGVSKSSFYAWMNRPKSKREQDNETISSDIQTIHKRSRHIYGILKITESLKFKGYRMNHKRVARLMRSLGIKSKVARKFRATTDSNHSLPVAENLLNREFHAEKRSQKWVSDITCVSSDEGWL